MPGRGVTSLAEDERQRRLFATPVGQPGSGYERYSAAMYLFNRGRVSAELLEVYRICCKLDHEDPVAVAAHEGIV